jgi:O-antigen ligase
VPARLALFLVGLAWVLPFLSPNFREPISSFYGEAAAIVLGLLAVSCLLFRSMWVGVVLPRSSLVFLAFIALILLHLAIGRHAYAQTNLLAILYLLWALTMAMLASRLREIFGQETLVNALSMFLLSGAVLSALICLWQLWGFKSPLDPYMLPRMDGRIVANTGQPNHLANYLALGIASLGYLHATGKLKLPVTVAAAAVLLVAMELSGSRAVFLYLAALFVVAGIFRFLRPSQMTSRLLGFSAVAAIGGTVVVLTGFADLLTAMPDPAMETLQTRLRSEGMQSWIRMRQWHEAWLMFLDAPVLGIGYHEHAWRHFQLNSLLPPPRLFELPSHHAHNLILHTMAEFGLAGLFALLVGFAAWLLGLKRGGMSAQTWWIFAVAAILGIHSMLEYPLWYAYFLGIAAMLIGVSDPVPVRAGSLQGGKLILMAMLLLGWMAAANIYQDYRTLQSLHRIQPREPGGAAGEGGDAATVLLELQQHSLFSPYVELALSRLIVADGRQIKDKLVLNEAVMHFIPTPDVVYRQAVLLALDGRIDEAKNQWDLAEKNFPSSSAGVIASMEGLRERNSAGIPELIRHAKAAGMENRQ